MNRKYLIGVLTAVVVGIIPATASASSTNLCVSNSQLVSVTTPLTLGGCLSEFTLTTFGEEGPEGKEGPKGTTGATGPEGKEGPTGTTGATGATGPEGPKGTTGATGAEGPKGTTGATGPEGKEGKIENPTYVGNEGFFTVKEGGVKGTSYKAVAKCASGKIAISGGIKILKPTTAKTYLAVTESYGGFTEWKVTLEAMETASAKTESPEYEVFALCIA
jgi:hypothetical protein